MDAMKVPIPDQLTMSLYAKNVFAVRHLAATRAQKQYKGASDVILLFIKITIKVNLQFESDQPEQTLKFNRI